MPDFVKKRFLNRYYSVGLQKFNGEEVIPMGNWRCKGALALSGLLLVGSSLTVCAEEVTPAGYHVYDVQESEASDTWYGISRGSYLQAGLTKVAEGSKAMYFVMDTLWRTLIVTEYFYVFIWIKVTMVKINGTHWIIGLILQKMLQLRQQKAAHIRLLWTSIIV